MSRMRIISLNRSRARAAPPRGSLRENDGDRSRLPRAHAIAHATRPRSARAAAALVSLALLTPSYAFAVENEDVAELRRMLQELQAQNRELSQRLSALESAQEASAAPRSKPAKAQQRAHAPDISQSSLSRRPAEANESPASATATSPSWLSRWPAEAEHFKPAPTAAKPASAVASSGAARPLPEPRDTTGMGLEERVKELEVGWAAQENATRQIIQDALSKTGPKINSYLALSGVIEVQGSRFRDFTGPTRDDLILSTTELDFDVKLSNWLTGALVLTFEKGTPATAPTTGFVTVTPTGLQETGPDRFTLDRTHIAIGDFTLFPIGARVGREVVPFGTSTGVARLDTLSIGTPLTTEVFENRQTVAGLEFAWPTPPLKPPPAPVVVPPVRPLVVAPLVEQWARWLGYQPLPQRPVRLTPVTPPIEPPPFYASFFVYKGNELLTPRSTKLQDFNASLGFRTSGHCGVPYEELRWSLVCPWTFDFHVDYDTSVFNSRFLESGYLPFLDQIGRVPGVAASVKASFGPFAVVGEVNTALNTATFIDGLGISKNIRPMTWQASIAYQFDWNPWITEIGHQGGDFISLAYSGSKDMAGAAVLINGEPTRVGFVPQHRLLTTWGEWVMDGLKLALEYSVNWDYPQSKGGTGQIAQGVFVSVQLNF
jgi:uncharacterized coiled-coil protein SlyX